MRTRPPEPAPPLIDTGWNDAATLEWIRQEQRCHRMALLTIALTGLVSVALAGGLILVDACAVITAGP